MHRGCGFGTAVVFALLFSAGCDLLNNKPEIDVERAIDGAVAYANAAILPVTVDEGGMGTASPRGTLTGIKQGVPFTLNYSSFAEYGFLGWEAVLASAPGTKLNADKVEFDPADKPETTVTVKINPGADRVIIRPVGDLAPVVGSFTPDIADGLVGVDRVIRIRFSRAIDPVSFLFDNGFPFEGNWKAAYDPGTGIYDGRVYKNILIESNNVVSRFNNSKNWAPLYYPPELSDDGTILTIALRPDPGTSQYVETPTQLTVTLNRDIRDTRGISLGRTYSFIIETQGTTANRESPMDDPPYPEILNNQNFVMVKASPSDADHPDGRIWPGAKIFKLGENDSDSTVPSSEPTHHFAYEKGDNWVYIAFQTELSDYAFAGALIYESVFDSGSDYKYDYTGQRAEPVYDPAIVTPLANHFREMYSASYMDKFNPSRPIRVVRYNLSKRTGTGDLDVSLYIIPLDSLDRPKEGASD
jgi:hypothetical protein